MKRALASLVVLCCLPWAASAQSAIPQGRVWINLIRADWKVGDTSVFPASSMTLWFEVYQVVDEDEMLVFAVGKPIGVRDRTEKLYYLKGFSTEGIVDDARLDLEDKPFKIAGTKRGWTRTVFLIQPDTGAQR